MENKPTVTPSPEWAYPGKRASARVDAPVPLFYCPFDDEKPDDCDYVESLIMDISMGGLLFKSDSVINIGQALWMKFDLAEIIKIAPGSDIANSSEELLIKIKGEVRQCEEHYQEGYVIGAKFDEIVSGDLQPLEKIIEIYG